MRKIISALLCTAAMLVGSVMTVFAKITVQSPSGSSSSGSDVPTHAVQQWFRSALEWIKTFWHNHGVAIVCVLIVAGVLITVAIVSIEDEKKKKRQAAQKHPEKQHK